MNRSACGWAFCWNSFSALPNPAFMPRASAAQPDGPAASPTPAPSSAPRTETTTAAPASAPSSHLEVRSIPQLLLLIYPFLNLSLLITHLVKHFYPPPCKCPGVHFIFPLCQYKVTADLQLYIWVLRFMSLNSINSDFFPELSDTLPLQVGGLRLAVHPTWMAYITPAHPVWFATMVLSGTIGRVQTWWLPWQPWWCARQTSDGTARSRCPITKWMSPLMNIMNNIQEIVYCGRKFKSDCQWFQPPDILKACLSNCQGTCADSQQMTVVLVNSWVRNNIYSQRYPDYILIRTVKLRDEGDRGVWALLQMTKTQLSTSNYAVTYDQLLNPKLNSTNERINL